MKAFIWKQLDQVSNNYHARGGLIVIAESLEEVNKLIEHDIDVEINKDPDLIIEVAINTEKRYIVFPDAGCC